MAMGVFEAMRLYGMMYVVDPTLPYDKVADQMGTVDFLQFPRETLLYTTGDCDDLTILFCSLLQSLDIDTAFITVPGHIFAAVSLGISALDAKRMFARIEDLIIKDNKAWLPVEITALNSAFLEAWSVGAREWREAASVSKEGFYPVRDAWKEYQPAAFPAKDTTLAMPNALKFQTVYGKELSGYVQQEIYPQVQAMKIQIAKAKDKSMARNRLGVLYARYGRMDEALEQFNLVLASGNYTPTVINKANILFLDGSYRDALALYQKALSAQKDAPTALLGIARCQFALKSYEKVADPFSKLKKLRPELAADYSYLDMGGSDAGSSRASEQATQSRQMAWEDEE
jgi:tetratricopeptide (TPR) repeat protein